MTTEYTVMHVLRFHRDAAAAAQANREPLPRKPIVRRNNGASAFSASA